MKITDFLPIPDLEKCRSLLCIQPHPDDNEVGAGATIAKLARGGCRITYLTVTDGSKGTDDPQLRGERLAKIRRKEAQDAAARFMFSVFPVLLMGISFTISRFVKFESKQ